MILLFHGPALNGPPHAVCADYKRKLPWSTPAMLREQQERDAIDLMQRADQWAGNAKVGAYLCEIDASHHIAFVPLDAHEK